MSIFSPEGTRKHSQRGRKCEYLGGLNRKMKIMSRLIIDGNSVYEVDEECLKKRKLSPELGIKEALERQEKRENAKATKHK